MAARATLILCICIVAITPARATRSAPDPFAFLKPTAEFSVHDREKLDRREIVVKILPADGRELAVMAAGALAADAETFVSSIRRIAQLKKSTLVPQIHRFSAEPTVTDVRELTLDDDDVGEIADCRPDDCGLKLGVDEIHRLRAAAGSGQEVARSALDEEFRQILVERARRYLRAGDQETRRQRSEEHTSELQSPQ